MKGELSLLTQDWKTFASFYTPPSVAQVLTNWAITSADTSVLDPSFGGCAFLYAALEKLQRFGCPEPAKRVYGVDIDQCAKSYLQPLLQAGAISDQFIISDYFSITPDHFGDGLFGAVVGNPPYIRYHSIPNDAQERAVNRLKEFGIEISGRASYWAFFLLYSMQFLQQDGRLAMVLPGALLHTDYSTQVRNLLGQHFEEIYIFLLEERIFENTEEESVLVCAAGARKPHRMLRIGSVKKADDLEDAFADIQNVTRAHNGTQGDGGWLRAIVDPETLTLYDELVANSETIRLGDWVQTRIGVVTGNNRFFILSQAEKKQRQIPNRFLVPVIRRSAHLTGLWVKDDDLKALSENGSRHLLLAIDRNDSKLPEAIQQYIEHGQQIGVHQAQKCLSRRPWYAVPNTFVPPALMQCMSASWPRLVVNQSSYTCTNNILRLLWKDEERQSEDWLRLALGTLSTLSQLSAELVGRSYGGGVLKLEPKELAQLIVPLIPKEAVSKLALIVDSSLRQGLLSKATTSIDQALIDSNIGLTSKKLKRLKAARDQLFLRRRQHRQDAQDILES